VQILVLLYIIEVLCLSLWFFNTFVVFGQLASVSEWDEVSSNKYGIISLLGVCVEGQTNIRSRGLFIFTRMMCVLVVQ
jgi:hypothetical protein